MHQSPDAARITPATSPAAAPTPTPEQRQVAQQFEAIFLRKMLSSMEKSGGLGGTGNGAEVYRSMMVGALADSAASGGGIGLADVIVKAMLPPTAPKAQPGAEAASPTAVGPQPPLFHHATVGAHAGAAAGAGATAPQAPPTVVNRLK